MKTNNAETISEPTKINDRLSVRMGEKLAGNARKHAIMLGETFAEFVQTAVRERMEMLAARTHAEPTESAMTTTNKPRMMGRQRCLALDAGLVRIFRRIALAEGISFSRYVERALREKVDRINKHKAATI